METVSLAELQLNPLVYVRRAQAGESVMIAENELPIAELKPAPAPHRERRPIGLADGEFDVPDDFDDPLPEDILRDFGV